MIVDNRSNIDHEVRSNMDRRQNKALFGYNIPVPFLDGNGAYVDNDRRSASNNRRGRMRLIVNNG